MKQQLHPTGDGDPVVARGGQKPPVPGCLNRRAVKRGRHAPRQLDGGHSPLRIDGHRHGHVTAHSRRLRLRRIGGPLLLDHGGRMDRPRRCRFGTVRWTANESADERERHQADPGAGTKRRMYEAKARQAQ